jgi:pimeloyl-ACP methyl ester carboxylesterase
VVLVHGAFADGSGWEAVAQIIEKDDYRVSVAQPPETSYADDVNYARAAIDARGGPVVLVGHSYGGSIISEAAMIRIILSTTLTIALATSATSASAGAWEAVSLAASTNCGEVRQLRFTGSVCISGKTATERAYLGEFLTAVANARPRCIKRQMSLR